MSFFDYVTYKYVVLRDVRLGLSYYLLALLIVIYTIVGIFYHKGYLEFDTKPQGVIRVLLGSSLVNESFDPGALPYCVVGAHRNISCRYVDPNELAWPAEGRAVTLTTFAKDRIQRMDTITNTPRDKYNIVQEMKYFTQGPEYAVLKVDHAVAASLFTDSRGREKLASSKRKMLGYLVSGDGTMKQISVPGKPDKLPVQWLLEAAGMEGLDEMSDSVNAKGRPYRERGCVLRVSIFYQNWYNTWLGTSDIEYMYQVKRIPHLDYTSKQVLPYQPPHDSSSVDDSVRWRLLRKRYSIRIEFEQAGSLGMFSLSTLLLKLVSGMGLLTLTATIIDSIALYLLPNRFTYRSSVYEQSDEIKTFKKKKE